MKWLVILSVFLCMNDELSFGNYKKDFLTIEKGINTIIFLIFAKRMPKLILYGLLMVLMSSIILRVLL